MSDNIRNICLLGHGSTGKTSLAESILYLTGMTDRLGKVVEGNSTCDPEMTKYISEENDGEPTPTNEDDIDPRWEALKNLK